MPPPPPGVIFVGDPVIELIDKNGQPNSAPLLLTGRKTLSAYDACIFPNGDRLIAYATTSPIGPGTNVDLQAAILRKSGKWEGPFFLFNQVSVDNIGIVRPLCMANGVARVIASVANPLNHNDTKWSHYADLADSDGWRPKQALNIEFKDSDHVTAPESVLHARSLDGRAVIAWNVIQSQPDPLTGQPSHESIPVIHRLQAGGKYFTGDINVPGYNPDVSADMAVRAVAWDPKRERFVFVLIGGVGATPRRVFADMAADGQWSSSTSLLPSQMLSNWQLDFNASGDGVLFARRHGQLLMSDWR